MKPIKPGKSGFGLKKSLLSKLDLCEACEAQKKVVPKSKKKSLPVIWICVMLCEACEACEAKIKTGAE